MFKNDSGLIHPSHNFGNVSPKQLKTFPFYSADSQTWKVSEKYGRNVELNLFGSSNQRRSDLTSYRGKNHIVSQLTENLQKYQVLEAELKKLWGLRKISWHEPKGLKV